MSDGIPIHNQEEPKCVNCTVCGWVLDTRGECTVCGGVSREESFTRVDFYRKGYEAGLDSNRERITELEADRDRLHNLIWNPENQNFLEGVRIEAAHQVDRWGTSHDNGKAQQDWFWLIGYLSGKALRATIDGDKEKALHHCISSAAVCANWHSHISGTELSFTPGLSVPPQID